MKLTQLSAVIAMMHIMPSTQSVHEVRHHVHDDFSCLFLIHEVSAVYVACSVTVGSLLTTFGLVQTSKHILHSELFSTEKSRTSRAWNLRSFGSLILGIMLP